MYNTFIQGCLVEVITVCRVQINPTARGRGLYPANPRKSERVRPGGDKQSVFRMGGGTGPHSQQEDQKTDRNDVPSARQKGENGLVPRGEDHSGE